MSNTYKITFKHPDGAIEAVNVTAKNIKQAYNENLAELTIQLGSVEILAIELTQSPIVS